MTRRSTNAKRPIHIRNVAGTKKHSSTPSSRPWTEKECNPMFIEPVALSIPCQMVKSLMNWRRDIRLGFARIQERFEGYMIIFPGFRYLGTFILS